MTPVVTVYERSGCHLCEDARAVIARIAADHTFSLHSVDIESDDATLKAYLERIPVIALDGEELYDFFVDEDDLRARLTARGATDGTSGRTSYGPRGA